MEIVRNERLLEHSKQQISVQSDFNTYDAFKVFDSRGLGFFDEFEFKAALLDIGAYASADEIRLFFHRYDTDRDGRIRYYEFCKIVEPLNPYYSAILNRRTSLNDRGRTLYFRDNCFSYGTRVLLRDLLKSLVQTEVLNDEVKRRLQRQVSVVDGFKALDVNRDDWVTPEEMQQVLDMAGYVTRDIDMVGLMNRLDKDRDGRVSYSEFADGMRP